MPIILDGSDAIGDLGDALDAKVTGSASATAPTSPITGQVFIDTDDSSLKIWNGSAWVDPSNAGGLVRAADVSGTTGSPTITTITDGGVGYTIYSFTSSGSITFSKAGLAQILVCGGGSGGYSSGSYYFGGGGGGVRTGFYRVAATGYTITVGAGSAVGINTSAGASSFGSQLVAGGGKNPVYYSSVFNLTVVGPLNGAGSGQLVIGASPGNFDGTGAGGSPSFGISSSITGSSVEYGKGGIAGSTAPSTNYGQGGAFNQAGISGIVIVRVKS